MENNKIIETQPNKPEKAGQDNLAFQFDQLDANKLNSESKLSSSLSKIITIDPVNASIIGSNRTGSITSSITKSSHEFIHPIRSFHSYIKPHSKHLSRKEKICHVLHNYLGIILTLSTSLIMSLGSFLIQRLQKKGGYSPFLTTFWRFIGILVPAIPTLIYFQCFTKKSVLGPICPLSQPGRWKHLCLVIARGVIGTGGFYLQYYALNYITLGDTSVIAFSSPVFVILFGRLCLKEECGIVPTIIAFCTIIGVMIIAKPPFIFGGEEMNMQTLTGILLAAGGCLSNTLVFICLRFLKDVHFSVISFIFGSIGLTITLIVALSVDAFVLPHDFEDTLQFVAIACIGFIGQVGLTFALKYEQAGIVSAFRTSDVIFSFLWQMTDGNPVSATSLAGAAVVITCVCMLAFRKWLAMKKPDDPCKIRCWWILK